MMPSTVHVAVFDTFADWEVGYAAAHIRSSSWQREPGRYSISTVGPTREPVTTMGGMRIMPGIALEVARLERELRLLADAAELLRVVLGRTVGRARIGRVGDLDEQLVAAGCGVRERVL